MSTIDKCKLFFDVQVAFHIIIIFVFCLKIRDIVYCLEISFYIMLLKCFMRFIVIILREEWTIKANGV